MSEKKESQPSAGGLMESLRSVFDWKREKLPKAPVAAAPTATPVPTETSTNAPEPTPTMTPGLTATEIPVPTLVTEAPMSLEPELPDWLQGGKAEAEVEAPLPETSASVPTLAPETSSALQAIEAPASPPEEKAESDPFATNREFNGYMETIRQAQAVLANGIALTLEEQRKALIAVARSNSLLPKLPSEVFKSVLLMRAVAANNPNFGRDDFQLEMLAAMNVIKTGVAIKG